MIEKIYHELEQRINETDGNLETLRNQENGYLMRELFLQMTLNGTQHFEDAGYKCVREEIDNLMETNPGMIKENPFKEGDVGSFGFPIQIDIRGIEFDTYLIFYDAQPDSEAMEWFNIGVQQAHALHHFEQTDFFKEAMEYVFKVKLPELQELPQTVVGQLGGIYATKVYSDQRQFTDIADIINWKEENSRQLEEFNQAMKLLNLY